MVPRRLGSLIALLLCSTLGLAANCGGGDKRKGRVNLDTGGSAGDASGGNGGSTGGKIGGTGGSKTGGTTAGGGGGASPAATGGSASGGSATGGSATGGSATGGSATGGSATGGSATGGSATGGSKAGGTGGTVVVTPPGPIAAPTSKDFFTGKGAAISTVVSGDAMPGYFYATGSFAMAPTVTVATLSSADQTGLPAGTTHAQRSDNPLSGGLLIVGWNFRANDGVAWRWVDVSAYAGITLWAKTGNTMPINGNFTAVDAKNLLTSEAAKGTCPGAPCVAVPGTPIIVTPTWQQFKIKFTDLAQDPALPAAQKGPVDVKQLGRIDILFGLASNVNANLLMTGVALATAAELQ